MPWSATPSSNLNQPSLNFSGLPSSSDLFNKREERIIILLSLSIGAVCHLDRLYSERLKQLNGGAPSIQIDRHNVHIRFIW